MCGAEREDIEHFVLKCRNLEHRRDGELIERLKGENEEETLGNLLFGAKDDDLEDIKEMLQKMWDSRKYQLVAARRRN